MELGRLTTYEGPTWLDEVIVANGRPDPLMPGFAVELSQGLAARGRWLVERGLAQRASEDDIAPKPDMMRRLRAQESHRIGEKLSRELKMPYVPQQGGGNLSGIYDRTVVTPSAKLAVIRGEDTFTLAPRRPVLEPMRGRAVVGVMRANRIVWSPDRGRELGRSL